MIDERSELMSKEAQASPSIDLKARKVIMSAYLYYRRSSPVLSDGAYDTLTREVAAGWPDLSPFRQWQLESPEALLASGSHAKVTMAAECGAIEWHEAVKGTPPDGYPITKWKKSVKWSVRWATADA